MAARTIGATPPPLKNECPDGNRGIQGAETKADDTNSATTDTAAQKVRATVQAEFAILGFALLELSDGSFIATRWNCCRPLQDLKAARSFLRMVSGGGQ
jgi:hypothetical protein